MNRRRQLGNDGEAFVAQYLVQKGFSILTTNYHARTGEVDLIAQRDELLAFVEVKTRRNNYFPIAATITRTKQKRVIKAAKHFLLRHSISDVVIRFDVATILWEQNERSLQYLPNAFTA